MCEFSPVLVFATSDSWYVRIGRNLTKVVALYLLYGQVGLGLLGGLGVMAPSRRQEIARLGLRAVLAATLANLMSASLAGIFLS